ncbi:hypothetical protein A8C75_14510 [Marinobacterium aestuarii]|uniref:DUF1468 domain-containing protein n=1 Tax=Marinobacterium aestuarii TaxID=1821621 RepID=A0A1A9F0A0_9GAMM|nr:tripartite tricarboxylate transporter TctB family protein [Marinobacterium aestuarii]ANG63567.1 hypothetical protein A8C75_14510 [Marinobacterium aestuarii]
MAIRPTARLAQWCNVALFVGLILLVFQQIATNMTAQGIASGGPYNNGAAYPQGVAIVLGVLVLIQMALLVAGRKAASEATSWAALVRPAALIALFALYLGLLGWLGYHIATPLMLAGVMLLCGLRRPVAIILPTLGVSFGLAWIFEAWLKIVLPGGIFHLNIAW